MSQFVAWQRPRMSALATAPSTSARLQAKLPITLHDGLGNLGADVSFLLAGPGDVAGLSAGQIVGHRPHPGAADVEATMFAHVELAAPDLPWRYSPVPHSPGVGVRPWLVLVVGTPEEVSVLADGRVRLAGDELFAEHPLAWAHRWAHVHDVPGRRFARIISPRRLRTAQDYIAVLVPGWQAKSAADGTTSLADSWPTAHQSVTLACFDRWTFRTTADEGDFARIAKRLDPLSNAEATLLDQQKFGRAHVTVGPLPTTTLGTGGALTRVPPLGEPPIAEPLPADVSDVVGSLVGDLEEDGRWVLTLPRYDAPWHPGPVDGEGWQWPPPGDEAVPDGWRRELRVDPRHRGAAGRGAWAAIAWQDRIAAGATRQAAAVAAAAQRIRHLTLGLCAARSLWRRRLPSDAVARLATLSPLLGRMPVDGGGSALDLVAGRTPMLAGALFSSSARRMLRRRGALARSAAPGATSLGGLIAAANRCPEPEQLSEDDERVLEALGDPDRAESLAGQAREIAGGIVYEVTGDERLAARVASSFEGDPRAADDLVTGLRDPLPSPQCRPLSDLDAFAGSVADGIDPTVDRPIVVDRVIGSITGLRPPLLAEPEVAPELDLPLWQFLQEQAPDWLLPGAGNIPADRVLAVQTNPTFVDAMLIGANHQTLGELRWRNLPITTRWTPLRRFWERIDIGAGTVTTDIVPVVSLADDQPIWTDASPLGDSTHLSDPANGTALVVLHTELFRRYPATLVYLTPNAGGAVIWGPVPDVDAEPALHREYPRFSGTLTPELVFFGFGVPPSAGADHWLVLEEPPPGYRFGHRPAADATSDGAAFAAATFVPPTRVFFGNLL